MPPVAKPNPSNVDQLLDALDWTELPAGSAIADAIPYATHSSVLRIGDHQLRCYQLSDGQRIINAEDVARLFGGGL